MRESSGAKARKSSASVRRCGTRATRRRRKRCRAGYGTSWRTPSTILARLRDTSLDLGPLDEIGDVMTQLNKNLDLMWLAWSDGIAAADQKRRAISETLAAYRQFGNIWRPRFADLNTQIVRLQRAMTSAGAGSEEGRAALDQFDQAMVSLLALDQIQREAGNAFELISRAANASRTGRDRHPGGSGAAVDPRDGRARFRFRPRYLVGTVRAAPRAARHDDR